MMNESLIIYTYVRKYSEVNIFTNVKLFTLMVFVSLDADKYFLQACKVGKQTVSLFLIILYVMEIFRLCILNTIRNMFWLVSVSKLYSTNHIYCNQLTLSSDKKTGPR